MCRSGAWVAIAGCVIARQRPGTAKGFVFLSMEDETGIANVILTPDVFERDRLVVTRSRFLRIEGPVQNQEGVIHVKAQRIVPLEIDASGGEIEGFSVKQPLAGFSLIVGNRLRTQGSMKQRSR